MNKLELTSSIEYKKSSTAKKFIEYTKDLFNNHPKALIITGVALTGLGALALSIGSASIIFPHVSIPLIISGAIITAIGTSILLATGMKWRHLLSYLIAVPLLSVMGIQWSRSITPQFEERNCLLHGKSLGNLRYENSIPVLELTTEDPYEMGLAQGYLLGKQIKEAFHEVLTPMVRLCGILTGDFSGKFYRQQAKQITIPEPYQREIAGLIAGAKEWAKQRGLPFNITEKQLLEANKLTDIYKAIGCQRILGIKGFNSFGCSTAVVKKDDQLAIGRTLDWPSLGKLGDFSYIKRYQTNGNSIEMHTYTGIMGALTAFNDKGLVAVINENGAISRKGIPYAMLARQLIEQNANVNEAEAMLNKEDYHPASSHHLTLADPKRAAIYQMVLEKDRKYIKRELDFTQKNASIVVTNHTVKEDATILEETICDPSSKVRYAKMTSSLKNNNDLKQLVKNSLQSVNTLDTVATAQFILDLKEKEIKSTKYTNSNYWAAKRLP